MALYSLSLQTLSVTHCNISFSAQFLAQQLLLSGIVSLLTSVLVKLLTPEISSFPLIFCHCLATRLSTSDSFTTTVLYKSIYLLTYFITSGHFCIPFLRNYSLLEMYQLKNNQTYICFKNSDKILLLPHY